jgi:hypothetical protein
MLSILVLIKTKTALNTEQWSILALKDVGIPIGRFRRKRKVQRISVLPVVSRLVLPQLRRQEEQRK